MVCALKGGGGGGGGHGRSGGFGRHYIDVFWVLQIARPFASFLVNVLMNCRVGFVCVGRCIRVRMRIASSPAGSR